MLPSDDTSYEWVIPFPEYEFVVSVATYVGNEDSYILSEKVTDFITLSEYQWNKIVCNNYELIKSSFYCWMWFKWLCVYVWMWMKLLSLKVHYF